MQVILDPQGTVPRSMLAFSPVGPTNYLGHWCHRGSAPRHTLGTLLQQGCTRKPAKSTLARSHPTSGVWSALQGCTSLCSRSPVPSRLLLSLKSFFPGRSSLGSEDQSAIISAPRDPTRLYLLYLLRMSIHRYGGLEPLLSIQQRITV